MIGRSKALSLAAFSSLCFLAVSACSSASTGGTSSKKESSSGTAVAVIDGTPITMGQLDERASKALFDIRQQTLEEMLSDQLLEKEAKAQGVTKEALLQKEVTAKVGE